MAKNKVVLTKDEVKAMLLSGDSDKMNQVRSFVLSQIEEAKAERDAKLEEFSDVLSKIRAIQSDCDGKVKGLQGFFNQFVDMTGISGVDRIEFKRGRQTGSGKSLEDKLAELLSI